MTESDVNRKLAAILSADVVGYSRLMANDEAATVETLKEYRAALGRVIERHKGRIVNAPGDNLLAEFPSAVEAVQAAVEIQKSVEGRNVELPDHRRMQFRVGVNLGDVIEEADGTIYGDGVNIASRMEALAEAGGICVSSATFEAVEGKIDFGFDFLGDQAVKNIDKPIRVYRVRVDPPPAAAMPKRGGGRRTLAMVIAAAIAAAAGLGVILWQVMHGVDSDPEVAGSDQNALSPAESRDAPSVVSDPYRIAVLPFVNISRDPNDEYFSDGITEELILQLSKVSRLRVVARTSVMKYKGSDADIAAIGEALGVGTILEGSVRTAADQVRVTAQLIDVTDESHLWSQEYDRDLAAIFAVQSDIASRVVEALKITLLDEERASIDREGTDNPEAYRLYLQGRHFLDLGTEEAIVEARARFDRAIAIDPDFALAYSGLARMHYEELWTSDAVPAQAFAAAKAAAEKALSLDDTLAEPHTVLAHVNVEHLWDWDQAEREFERALALNPSDAYTHAVFAHTFLNPVRGRPDAAIAETQKAISLDPLSAVVRERSGWVYLHAGRYQDSITQFTEALTLAPTNFWIMIGLGRTYGRIGDYETAIEWLEKGADLSEGSSYPLAYLGWVYGMAGRTDDALQILERLRERAKTESVPEFAFVAVHMGLRQMDEAFVWIEKAYRTRSNYMLWLGIPTFSAGLSGDPRYVTWMNKMNLRIPESALGQ